MYFAIIVIAVPIHAYKKYKLKFKNYFDISDNEMSIFFGHHADSIQLSDITKIIIYNICGNKNFVIYHSDKSSSFLLNGLHEEFISEISKLLNGVEVKKASVFDTLKYVIKPS